MRSYVFVAQLAMASCASAGDVTLSFPGATTITVEESVVKTTREVGSIGGRYISSAELHGPPGAGPVTVTNPHYGPMMIHITPIKESCAAGMKKGVHGLGEVSTSDRFFRDYVGPNGLDASWHYWISFTPSFCQVGRETDYDPDVDAYFVCAGQSAKFRCIRDVARLDYSAYFFIESEQLANWRKLEADVAAYLDRVVKPKK